MHEPTSVIQDSGLIGGALRDRPEGPVFQFYGDLNWVAGDIRVYQVTDKMQIVGTHREGEGIYYNQGNLEFVQKGASLICINDTGIKIVQVKNDTLVLKNRRELDLECSPVMKPSPAYVNSDSFIAGCVRKQDIPYARIWDENGNIFLDEKTSYTTITKLAAKGAQYGIGMFEDDGVLWNSKNKTVLRGPDMEKVMCIGITGAGLVGGSYIDSDGISRAGGWNSDGRYINLELPNSENHSTVCALLEDGTFIIESTVVDEGNSSFEYFIGRPGSLRLFTSASIHSVEGFPLVSIDAVSPLGFLVATVQSTDLNRIVPILIGPEGAQKGTKYQGKEKEQQSESS